MDGAGELTQIFLLGESIGKTSKTVLFAPLRMLCVLCEKLLHAKRAEVSQRRKRQANVF